jgi:PPOX class probable F420-dependent enzyme
MKIDDRTKFGRRVLAQLENEQVIWLTTVRTDGLPQTSPVWFYWDEETFLIYSKPGKPKVRNIEQNPMVTLHFNCDFAGHEVAVFSGTAVPDPNAPPPNEHSGYANKYADGITTLNMTPTSFAAVYKTAVRIIPQQLRGH